MTAAGSATDPVPAGALSLIDSPDLMAPAGHYIGNWPEFDRLHQQRLGSHRPSRAVAGAKELHYGSAVEVHAIAALH
ncbi:hypothetical protein [Streptomyces sp. NPDC058249]|uniref:hypothetical protein n=1 Tax=Streptomyces sp. NPDC058249 TaxID=3346403 RepID=UPI0036EE574F